MIQIWQVPSECGPSNLVVLALVESFFNVKYGSSIITSKVSQKISAMKTPVFVSVVFKTNRELKCQNELFLKYHFSGNTSVFLFCFYYCDYLTNFWRNNWQSIIDMVERLSFWLIQVWEDLFMNLYFLLNIFFLQKVKLLDQAKIF